MQLSSNVPHPRPWKICNGMKVMVGIWHEINVLSSKINMLNQNKCFFMSLGSKKEVTGKHFLGSCAKLSKHKKRATLFVDSSYLLIYGRP